jgi:hypothetical protein
MIQNITFVLFLLFNISTRQYCPPGTCPNVLRYTCSDFTADAVNLLRENNITAYPMLGFFGYQYHNWVGVEINGTFYNIEPQRDEIVIPNSVYYTYGRHGVARGIY